MQYRFNRKYLKFLLQDSLELYRNKIIDFEQYSSIKEDVQYLLDGTSYDGNNGISIKKKLIEGTKHLLMVRDLLSFSTLESLLNISEEIILNPPSKVVYPKIYPHKRNSIVEKALEFYRMYDIEEYDYLKKFINMDYQPLEIVPLLDPYRHRYNDVKMVLSYYGLSYVRVIDTITDEVYGSLVHEFSHIIDKKNTDDVETNYLNEVNSIFKELLFSIQNSKFKNQIVSRLNILKGDANVLYTILELSKKVDKNHILTLDMIGEVINTGHFELILNTLNDISSDYFLDSVTYTLGTLLAIHLCNIADYDMNSAREISNRIKVYLDKDLSINDLFNLDLGLDLKQYKTDLKEYKKFIKKYGSK